MTTIFNYLSFKTLVDSWWAEFHVRELYGTRLVILAIGAHGTFRQEALRNAEKLIKEKYGNISLPEVLPKFMGGK